MRPQYLTLAFLLTLFAYVGCSTQARISLDSGLDVTATSDTGQVTLSQEANEAVIKMAGRIVLVGPSIAIDKENVCEVPEGTKVIHLALKKGTLTITADGKSIHQQEL